MTTMHDDAMARAVRRITVVRRYALPEGAERIVGEGDAVAAGERLAHMPPHPEIVAFSDELGRTAMAAGQMLRELNGTSVREGEPLGSARAGLRTHIARSPMTGTLTVAPHSGALIVRAPHDAAVYASMAGVVIDIQPRGIVVESPAIAFHYVYARTSHRSPGAIIAAPEGVGGDTPAKMTVSQNQRDAFLVIAHIANRATLSKITKQFPGTLLVGTMAEEAAWQALAMPSDTNARKHTDPNIVVLEGIGDPARGRAVIEPLLDFVGHIGELDGTIHAFVIYGEALHARKRHTLSTDADVVEHRDPARWGVVGEVHGAATLETIETGYRGLVHRTTAPGVGAERTPVVNSLARRKNT